MEKIQQQIEKEEEEGYQGLKLLENDEVVGDEEDSEEVIEP